MWGVWYGEQEEVFVDDFGEIRLQRRGVLK